MPHNMVSDQGLQCLPLKDRLTTGSSLDLSLIKDTYAKGSNDPNILGKYSISCPRTDDNIHISVKLKYLTPH